MVSIPLMLSTRSAIVVAPYDYQDSDKETKFYHLSPLFGYLVKSCYHHYVVCIMVVPVIGDYNNGPAVL